VKPTYVTHSQPEEWNIWNAFTPYAQSTWLSMCIMFILQTIFCIYVAHLEVRMGRRRHFKPYQVIWMVVLGEIFPIQSKGIMENHSPSTLPAGSL
jgi:hypothetical protein